VLRKERPSTGPRPLSAMGIDSMKSAPSTPSRPATSGGLNSFSPDTARSRHTIHFSPNTPDRPNTSTPLSSKYERPQTATPLSSQRPERPQTSTPLSANKRWSTLHIPKSLHRPATSAGMESERPTTSAGEHTTGQHKGRKRWSIRRLFRSS
jgi:hypothetical protein